MFINKTADGKNNLCGKTVATWRTKEKLSQRELADKLQVAGLDIDKNAVQRIESGKRFVTDIELRCIAQVTGLSLNELIK